MRKNPIRFIKLTLLFIITLSLFSVSPFTTMAESSVSVPNGSFEQQTTSGTKKLPKDWTFNYPPYVSYPSTTSVSGNSVMLTSGTSSLLTITSKSFAIEGGKTYEFSFHCLAESADTTASIKLQPYGKNGLKKDAIEQSFSVSKSSWQRLSFETSIDQDVTKIQIILSVNVKSTVCYVDEVGVKEVISMPDLKLTTLSGASLRLIKDSAGIRFRGTVDKNAYDEYCKKFENVSAGILFTVEENLNGVEDFTVSALAQRNRVYKCITAEKWNNQKTLQTDGFYGFNCAIINIKEMNISRNYCARTYLKYDINGKTEYIYGNFSIANNARSVKELAVSAMEDLDSFAPEQIEIIEYFANHGN